MGMAVGYVAFPPPPRAESRERVDETKGETGGGAPQGPASLFCCPEEAWAGPKNGKCASQLWGCQSHRTLDCSGGQALGPCPGTCGDMGPEQGSLTA